MVTVCYHGYCCDCYHGYCVSLLPWLLCVTIIMATVWLLPVNVRDFYYGYYCDYYHGNGVWLLPVNVRDY